MPPAGGLRTQADEAVSVPAEPPLPPGCGLAMQPRQTAPEGRLIAADQVQPGKQQQRRVTGCRKQFQGFRHHQIRWISHGMQSGQAPLFGLKHVGFALFGKQMPTITEGQLPGLLTATSAQCLTGGQMGALQKGPGAVKSGSKSVQHPQVRSLRCQHARMKADQDVIVIGGGIAGLTAGALLAREGLAVTLLEAHHQLGGCAGTFRRGPYTFDVGATQVAGFEPGGSHARIFRHLDLPLPDAQQLDPGCVVDLADGSAPIPIWHDPERWQRERRLQFPGSERFWALCAWLHRSNWAFADQHPVLPVRTGWDLQRTLQAVGLGTLATAPFALLSVSDLLQLCDCADNTRLRRFLDLQLRLYSQEPAERTAALYGATVLQMVQAPLGLWHLEGSMQVLSDLLGRAMTRDGGRLELRQRVTRLEPCRDGGWTVTSEAAGGRSVSWQTQDVICSLPPQCLPKLMPATAHRRSRLPAGYRRRIRDLEAPSGALVLYGAVDRRHLPLDCPAHLQRDGDDPGSLFVSISRDGDGRAPRGQATVIASVFTDPRQWADLPEPEHQTRKTATLAAMRRTLDAWLGLPDEAWLHLELSTPRAFAHWTGRPQGIVGGLGQHPTRFGPFGLASRTPLPGLWLCGDSIYPGEGTAGVSLSALMACQQLMAMRGTTLRVA